MNFDSFKKILIIGGILLFIQYWLGMVVNLFVEIPTQNQLNFLSYSGGIEVFVHIVNGVLILVIGLITILISFRLTNKLFSRLSLVAILFVAAAITSGVIYIIGGFDNSFSMAMAMSFISTFTLYFYIYYLVGKTGNSNFQ